jgi:lysophospholipase L1-like esterase
MPLVNFLTDETVETPTPKDSGGTRMLNAAEVVAKSILPDDLNLVNTKLGHIREALRDGSVPFAAAGGGTAERSLAARAAELNSVLDFGGATDGATDCKDALNAAAGNAGYAGLVKMPKMRGTANTYYFSEFIPANFAGITLDVDDGVTLSIASDEIMSSMARSIRFARRTRFYWRNLNRYYWVSNAGLMLEQPNGTPPIKDVWLDDASFERARYSAVLCNTAEVTPRYIQWNTSDAWGASGFSASDAKSYRLAPGAAGYFHAGMRSVMPGDELMAGFGTIDGTPFLAALVRHADGYVGIFTSTDDAASSIQRIVKTTGVAGASSSLNPLWQGNHASYAPKNATWSIRVEGRRRCSIYLNGWCLTSFETTGDIFEAGFGLYVSGASDGVVVQDVVLARGRKPTRGGLLSVGIFGDSRSSPRLDCWPDFLPQALDQTAGLRVWKVNNLAVAGEASAAQLAALTAVGAAAFDVVVIDIGTNDVQGGVAVATFLSNVSSMVALCKAAGKPVILTVPDLWYTQTQAAGGGQASTSYAAGGPYRTAILRLAAEQSVPVIDSPALAGPILAHYVNPALGVDLTLAGDPSLSDNIHPTSALNRLRAREVAKAICGALLPEVGALAADAIHLGTAGSAPAVLSGAGTPEAVHAAPVGSLYLRTDGGVGTTLYKKTSGTGNTGWTAS